MFLDEVDAADNHAMLARQDCMNLSLFPAVIARDDLNRVALFDFMHSYKTSGARETIFMNPLSRNSRATGPKMRVPRGLFVSASRITAAFSSKRMYEPSRLPYSFNVRTITARTTSPFFTELVGIAALTLAMIMS